MQEKVYFSLLFFLKLIEVKDRLDRCGVWRVLYIHGVQERLTEAPKGSNDKSKKMVARERERERERESIGRRRKERKRGKVKSILK